MTCIAWDGEVMAADSMSSLGPSYYHMLVNKLVHFADGSVGATAGDAAAGRELSVWYDAGCVAKDFPASCRDKLECPYLLVATTDGQLKLYENGPYGVVIKNQVWAIGSGSEVAITAMKCGLSAVSAVEMACAELASCGGPVNYARPRRPQ